MSQKFWVWKVLKVKWWPFQFLAIFEKLSVVLASERDIFPKYCSYETSSNTGEKI